MRATSKLELRVSIASATTCDEPFRIVNSECGEHELSARHVKHALVRLTKNGPYGQMPPTPSWRADSVVDHSFTDVVSAHQSAAS